MGLKEWVRADLIRHKVVYGICYKVEVTEKNLGRCEEHNPPKKEKKA